jgi:predicted RNA-binding protein with PIN domain
MEHYIIDGYNVIHAIPSLHKTLLHDAESSRELFIHSVSQLTHQKKFRCSIVFDGSVPGDFHKQSLHAPVHVLYSFPLSADNKIKNMIEQSKNRSKLVIITSDREILSFAKNYSCQTYSSKYFANFLKETDPIVTEKSDTVLTPSQVNEWLKIFGEK